MNKKKNGYITSFLSLILLFLLPIAGCSADSKQQGDSRSKDKKGTADEVLVNQVTPSLLNMPLYIAAKEGFFEQENLRVKVETVRSRDKAAEDLLSSKTPILLDYPETLLYLTQQKSENDLVYFAQTASATGCFLLARDNKKPFSWQDLKGKVIIGYKDGELPEVVFEYTLKKNGLKPHQNVNIIQNLPYQAFQGVFKAGTGHYILATEPIASQMEKENAATVTASIEPFSGPLVTAVCITSREYLHSHRQICLKFVRALYKGQKWLDEHSPEEIAAAAGKYFLQDESVLLRGVSRYKTLGLWTLTPHVDQEGLIRLQEIMLYEKELNNQIPLDKLIDNTVAEEASAGTN